MIYNGAVFSFTEIDSSVHDNKLSHIGCNSWFAFIRKKIGSLIYLTTFSIINQLVASSVTIDKLHTLYLDLLRQSTINESDFRITRQHLVQRLIRSRIRLSLFYLYRIHHAFVSDDGIIM